MNLQEIIAYLKENKFLLKSGDTFVMSKEFLQACKRQKGEIIVMDMSVVDKEKLDLSKMTLELGFPKVAKTISWDDVFIQFIKAAQVPNRLENNRNEVYAANKFNSDACKVFRKAIEKEGYDYDLLIKSTMLYYKSSLRFKKAIGTYFTSGDFRTDYLNLKNAAETSSEELQSHIKQEIKDNGHNAYTLG